MEDKKKTLAYKFGYAVGTIIVGCKKNLAYKFGYAAGTIIVGCLTIAVIAVTIRFIMWLF